MGCLLHQLFEELLFCEPKEVESKEKDIWCGGNRGDGANRLAQSANGQWLKDYGARFDLTGYQPPDLSRPAESGYGIYLMKTLMDSIEYLPQKAGTRLVMVKSRGNGNGVDEGGES